MERKWNMQRKLGCEKDLQGLGLPQSRPFFESVQQGYSICGATLGAFNSESAAPRLAGATV